MVPVPDHTVLLPIGCYRYCDETIGQASQPQQLVHSFNHHRQPCTLATLPCSLTSSSRSQVQTHHRLHAHISIHILTITPCPACLSFLLQPNAQLRDPNPSPEAVLVCQSYAGLLLATNVLCLFCLRSRGLDHFDEMGGMLTASLAVYHAFPIRRAWVRIQQGRQRRIEQSDRSREATTLGGPVLHSIVHFLLLLLLAWAALDGASLP